MTQIIKSWPDFQPDEISSVTKLLASPSFAADSQQQNLIFEQACAKATQKKHAVSLANDTVALEIALQALGIKSGDEIILPARITIEAAAPVLSSGATPVIADIDEKSQNITAETIKNLISDKTKAVICFHNAGWPCEMDKICELARQNSLKIIEICSQAQGARYQGKPVGSFADVAILAFGSDAIVSTGGEGGMLLCDDSEIMKKAYDFLEARPVNMTPMQAALGYSQLLKLDQMVEIRRNNAAKFDQALSASAIFKTVTPPEAVYHAYNHYYCFLTPEAGLTVQQMMQQLSDMNIPITQPVCPEIYKEKSFPSTTAPLPVAQKLSKTAIALPVHPALTPQNLTHLTTLLRVGPARNEC